jgi:hypothetical protein
MCPAQHPGPQLHRANLVDEPGTGLRFTARPVLRAADPGGPLPNTWGIDPERRKSAPKPPAKPPSGAPAWPPSTPGRPPRGDPSGVALARHRSRSKAVGVTLARVQARAAGLGVARVVWLVSVDPYGGAYPTGSAACSGTMIWPANYVIDVVSVTGQWPTEWAGHAGACRTCRSWGNRFRPRPGRTARQHNRAANTAHPRARYRRCLDRALITSQCVVFPGVDIPQSS